MRPVLVFAASVLLAGPAVAADPSYSPPSADSPVYAGTSLYTGEVEFGAAVAKSDNDTITQFDATGRLAGPLGGWLKAEGEVLGSYTSFDHGSYSRAGVVGHFYKEGPTHAVGVTTGVVSVDDETAVGVGIEGKAWLGNNVLIGQTGYIWGSNDARIYVATGEFDHYFTPDFKGVLGLAYAAESHNDSSLMLAGAGLEKRITGTPWSLFASGSFLHVDYTHSDANIWGLRVGARVLFDAPGTTLEQHERLVPFTATWLNTATR